MSLIHDIVVVSDFQSRDSQPIPLILLSLTLCAAFVVLE